MKEAMNGITVEEIEFIRRTISGFDRVFSHNDIWTGNIIVKDISHDVVFVDYEVMDYNFAGYDIGKLLMEFLYDRHPSNPSYVLKDFKDFLSEDDMNDFIKHYFITYYGRGRDIKNVLDENEFNTIWDELYKDHTKEDIDSKLEKLRNEVRVGIMIAGWYSQIQRYESLCLVGLIIHGIQFCIYRDFNKKQSVLF